MTISRESNHRSTFIIGMVLTAKKKILILLAMIMIMELGFMMEE
jgi:hypothetical protein